MITERDLAISCYLETYKFATVEQLEKIFFKEQQYSYNLCLRRLGKLKEAGYIKIYRDKSLNKNIYLCNDDKLKPPSMSRLKILDVLAEIYYSGFHVERFEIEKFWCGGSIRSDAFIIFTVEGRRYHFFLEVQFASHPHNLEKYDTLYETGAVQEYLGKDFFPRVLLVCDRHFENIELKHTKVVQLDTKLHAFPSILI